MISDLEIGIIAKFQPPMKLLNTMVGLKCDKERGNVLFSQNRKRHKAKALCQLVILKLGISLQKICKAGIMARFGFGYFMNGMMSYIIIELICMLSKLKLTYTSNCFCTKINGSLSAVGHYFTEQFYKFCSLLYFLQCILFKPAIFS